LLTFSIENNTYIKTDKLEPEEIASISDYLILREREKANDSIAV
jgi:hypothetical protein